MATRFRRQPARPLRLLLLAGLTLFAALWLAPAPFAPAPAGAQTAGYGQTMGTSPVEKQFYDYGPSTGSSGGSGSGSGSLFNSTNPLDLMNKLRKSTSLDDATPPGTAVDQALRDLEAQSAPTTAGSGASRMVQSP
ncbi:MAG: hypothetical protein VKK62_06170 [Synechococcaceae cyanobacterium]|nr:hypothetical protein [Synechococcaceae cyanobacterium]